MTDILNRLPQGELVLRALFRDRLNLVTDEEQARVGRDLLGTPPEPWYVRVQIVPGGGADKIQGDVVLDVEVFGRDYLEADSLAGDLEAILLGYPHVVEVGEETVVIDSVDLNVRPHETFWDDETVTRILATYVITMRR